MREVAGYALLLFSPLLAHHLFPWLGTLSARPVPERLGPSLESPSNEAELGAKATLAPRGVLIVRGTWRRHTPDSRRSSRRLLS